MKNPEGYWKWGRMHGQTQHFHNGFLDLTEPVQIAEAQKQYRLAQEAIARGEKVAPQIEAIQDMEEPAAQPDPVAEAPAPAPEPSRKSKTKK
jgi:hypothetical protein